MNKKLYLAILWHQHQPIYKDTSHPTQPGLWTYVGRLRNKLEPDPAQPRYILTEPGVGYRFRSVRD